MDDLRGRRVLVTGAAGFVGTNLSGELVRRGTSVHVLVRPTTSTWRLAEILPWLTVHRVDLADADGIRRAVAEIRPEVIFHLAKAGVGGVHDPWGEMVRSNVLGTANLLEATSSAEYHRFVYTGSSLEYGKKEKPLEESDLPEPTTGFGATKAAATLLCQQFARARGRPVAVLRLFSVYGYWQSPARLVPTAIRAALHREELPLTSSGYRRDWTFIEDVVEALLRAVHAEGIDGEIINVGTGQQATNEEVVEIIQALCQREIRVRAGAYPARPTDTTCWVADVRKARRLLGWEPRHSLRQGLDKTIEWWRLHQDVWADPPTSQGDAGPGGARTDG